MATSILHRRGPTAQVNSYTGPEGELVVNTTEKTILVQDGSTPGGTVIAKYSDIPTKTSQLTNDSGYISSGNIPSKTSQLTNDSGFVTSSGSVNYATTAGTANKVDVSKVQNLSIGALTFKKSATSYSSTFTVEATRDVYGRLTNLNVSGANCNCNCNCNCDCSDSDTDG